MKNFGEKNHGKVFEERDGYVTLWEPVKDFILKLYNESNMKNLYTENEIIVCTYISRFGYNDFTESDVEKITNRSLSSIKMKVQNIASMLDESGAETSDQVSKLTGLPAGQTGRKTNWDIVKNYKQLPKSEHRKKCLEILSK